MAGSSLGFGAVGLKVRQISERGLAQSSERHGSKPSALAVGGLQAHTYYPHFDTKKEPHGFFKFVAGVVGFEPTHHGVRDRCLTAWRYPNNLEQVYFNKTKTKTQELSHLMLD